MKVYVIGYMGVGKTTWGKRLASLLDLPFVDLDATIEAAEGVSIARVFEDQGEAAFRQMEAGQLRQFAERHEPGLLSTGGGAPVHGDNMEWMLKTGTVVWFNLPPEVIASRVLRSKDKRPILKGLEGDALVEKIRAHMDERLPVYGKAHLQFSTMNVDSERLETLAQKVRNQAR